MPYFCHMWLLKGLVLCSSNLDFWKIEYSGLVYLYTFVQNWNMFVKKFHIWERCLTTMASKSWKLGCCILICYILHLALEHIHFWKLLIITLRNSSNWIMINLQSLWFFTLQFWFVLMEPRRITERLIAELLWSKMLSLFCLSVSAFSWWFFELILKWYRKIYQAWFLTPKKIKKSSDMY